MERSSVKMEKKMKSYISHHNDVSKDRDAFEKHKDAYYARLFHAIRRAVVAESDNMGAELFGGTLIFDAKTITEVCGHVAALFSAEMPVNFGTDAVAAVKFRDNAARYIGAAMAAALTDMADLERADPGTILKTINLGFVTADGSPIERAEPGEKAPE